MDEATTSPQALADALERTGYLPDGGLATAAFLALRMHRPLFLEGDAGVGKTSLASALAEVLDAPLVRLQCYEGIDAAQALYDWDFPRQVLHLRAAEGRDPDELERSLYDRRFLVARPILQAIEQAPCVLLVDEIDRADDEFEAFLLERPLLEAVRAGDRAVLLIDEIDRADDEFEAFLLEVLSDFQISIPEIGTVKAQSPPLVVLTSNRTREVHDALKRRCFYHWLAHPSYEREVAILQRRLPEVAERLARDVARVTARLREADLLKPPGVAESLDWALALHLLGARYLDADNAAATLGAVLKYHEDAVRARETVLAELTG